MPFFIYVLLLPRTRGRNATDGSCDFAFLPAGLINIFENELRFFDKRIQGASDVFNYLLCKKFTEKSC